MNANIERARELLAGADRVLIGAGAGLSTAAGLAYGGKRFQQYFAPFIERYGMTDMYSAGFYPFPAPEDKWAYWSQHIWVNRFEPGATQLYRDLAHWAHGRDCFVITTNVDAQFELAGFDPQRIFVPQGDYGYIQCARACHERIYPVKDLVEKWRTARRNSDAHATVRPRARAALPHLRRTDGDAPARRRLLRGRRCLARRASALPAVRGGDAR